MSELTAFIPRPKQHEVLAYAGGRMGVSAVPGSGKTWTLSRLAAEIIASGVLADDQRRAGAFTWPPPKENYVYEALQDVLLQAIILHRAGYDTFNWQDQAILRAYRWLHEQANFPAKGDDTWQPHVVNHFYGTNFPAPVPSAPGKSFGWTDWVYGTIPSE